MAENDFIKKLSKSPQNKATGKQEVLACKEDIIEALKQHFALTDIYNLLKKEKRITIKYTMFARHVKKLIKGDETPKVFLKNEKNTSLSSQKKTSTPNKTGLKVAPEFTPNND